MKRGFEIHANAADGAPTARASKALVIKLSSLGDLLHALPAVRQIRQQTGSPVDWVVQEEYADLVRCFTDVDRVIPFPRHGGIRDFAAFLRDLRARRYDLVVDLQGLLKSALPARLARGRRVLGPSYAREGARLFYSAVAGKQNLNRHIVDQALDVARFLNIPEADPVFPVRFPRVRRTESGVRIALIPFSRWPTKNWPADHFANLARGLNARIPCTFYLIGGPDDAQAGQALEKQMAGLSVVSFCGPHTLSEVGSLLQEMNLAISVDTGPLHLAAALGIPSLALYGPTDPARTGPYGEGHRVLLVDGLSCRPCFSRTCSRNDHACMARLYPSQAVDAAVEMLKYVPRDRPGGG